MNLKTIHQLLQNAQQQLASITDTPAFEAELLLALALEKPRTFLHAWPDHIVPDIAAERFANYLTRRCQKEPIAYITGTKEFWSLELSVNAHTLIPRPETELLIELILKIFPNDQELKVADLGTGSGAIALALASERPSWQIHAVDVSENALEVARKNAQRLGFDKVSFHCGSWCTALPYAGFDVIVSNPPYIAETEWKQYAEGLAFEPRNALISGEDGLKAIREISQASMHYLKPGGYLFIEHGFLQGSKVREIFATAGYDSIQSIKDLSGQERVTFALKPFRQP